MMRYMSIKRRIDMSNDKIKGDFTKAKGAVKEAVGEATDDSSMKAKGKTDKVKGEAQKKYGELKDKL